MKERIYALFTTGTIGSVIAGAFGGWDKSLQALLIFMLVDFITGLMVAGIWHNSEKSKTGGLESKISFKGLCRKCTVLLFVLVGVQLDQVVGATYIRDAICIAFMVNELISIVENGKAMGLPIPGVITDAIDTLKGRAKQKKESNEEENKND